MLSGLINNQSVIAVYDGFTPSIREKTLQLRQIIFDVASTVDGLTQLEETLKWGEPSYLAKHGSTIRINAVKSNSQYYALYFHCKTTLIETFKELYAQWFNFDGNRAIIFSVKDDSHFKDERLDALRHCILLSLTYHKIKNLPLLGC